jgi:tetratricopeptide (TPR) repeat protein
MPAGMALAADPAPEQARIQAAAATVPATAAATAAATVPATAPADPFAALADAEKKLGQREEDAGDLLTAAYHYEMVANLSSGPAKADVLNKAAALRQQAKTLASQLFQEGMAASEKNQIGPAFRALLRSLSYDPANQAAVKKIKDELIGTSVVSYTAVAGDTLAAIAQKNKFEDPSLAWIIGAYNDIGEDAQVKPGQTLKVPLMIGVLPKAATRGGAPAQDQEDAEYDNNSSSLAQARELLNSNKFEEASKLAGKVLADDPVNKDAKEVANASNYGLGKRLADGKKYEAALLAYARADPNYRDTRQQMTAMRGQVVNSAEEHYASGIKYFVNDDMDNAIKEFETTLALNPNHPQAAKDLQQARETREKLRALK